MILVCADREDFDLCGSAFMKIAGITDILAINQDKEICTLTITIVTIYFMYVTLKSTQIKNEDHDSYMSQLYSCSTTMLTCLQ